MERPENTAKNRLATVKLINACHFHKDTPKTTMTMDKNVTIRR
jgi:hypothetical protein